MGSVVRFDEDRDGDEENRERVVADHERGSPASEEADRAGDKADAREQPRLPSGSSFVSHNPRHRE